MVRAKRMSRENICEQNNLNRICKNEKKNASSGKRNDRRTGTRASKPITITKSQHGMQNIQQKQSSEKECFLYYLETLGSENVITAG